MPMENVEMAKSSVQFQFKRESDRTSSMAFFICVVYRASSYLKDKGMGSSTLSLGETQKKGKYTR